MTIGKYSRKNLEFTTFNARYNFYLMFCFESVFGRTKVVNKQINSNLIYKIESFCKNGISEREVNDPF